MGSSVSFVSNGIVPIANVTSNLDCSTPLPGCTDQSACNFAPLQQMIMVLVQNPIATVMEIVF